MNWDECGNNPFSALMQHGREMGNTLMESASSIIAGAILEIIADGIPVGLGQPVWAN